MGLGYRARGQESRGKGRCGCPQCDPLSGRQETAQRYCPRANGHSSRTHQIPWCRCVQQQISLRSPPHSSTTGTFHKVSSTPLPTAVSHCRLSPRRRRYCPRNQRRYRVFELESCARLPHPITGFAQSPCLTGAVFRYPPLAPTPVGKLLDLAESFLDDGYFSARVRTPWRLLWRGGMLGIAPLHTVVPRTLGILRANDA